MPFDLWLDFGCDVVLTSAPYDLHKCRLRDVDGFDKLDFLYFQIELVLKGPGIGRNLYFVCRHYLNKLVLAVHHKNVQNIGSLSNKFTHYFIESVLNVFILYSISYSMHNHTIKL